MKNHISRWLLAGTALCTAAFTLTTLSGCAATNVALSKRELDVQTKMSATIFLDPVKASDRTIFVQMRNTSDQSSFDVAEELVNALKAKGYQVVSDPEQAYYYLQANVLYVGKSSPTAAQSVGGYGTPMSGAVSGLAVAGATGNSGRSMVLGALVGGVVDTVSGAVVKDVYYSVVTDVQIKERLAAGKTAQVQSAQNLKQGTAGSEQVNFQDTSTMRAYQTRVTSTANKVNLDLAEALPGLRAGLVRSLSGMF